MTREGCQGGICMVWGDGDEEPAGSLRIEKKVLIFGGDACVEFCALADERAIVF